jgi:LDH2 family malate/lactate/ureidoglycolate dehydrogenase
MTLGRLRLSVADARGLAEGALRGIGYHNDEARIIADHVIEAALCGYEYSGLAKILNVFESEHFRLPRRSMKVSLMMQALGLLAGSGLDAESDYGYLFVAFRPDLIGSADAFERQVTQLIERIKATPRQPGVDHIRIPSERAFRSRERALREGLEIDRVVFDALVALRAR